MDKDGLGVVIFLLGNARLSAAMGPIPFPQRGYQLFAILSFAPSYQLTRKQIAQLIWGNSAGSDVLANLRQLLVRMRRSFPQLDQVLGADINTISLVNSGAQIDLCVLNRLLLESAADTAPETIIDLLTGPLLHDIDQCSDDFDHWLSLHRNRLCDSLVRWLERTLFDATRFGTSDIALLHRMEDRVFGFEPDSEPARQILISAYQRIGRIEDVNRLNLRLLGERGEAPPPKSPAIAYSATTDSGNDSPHSAGVSDINRVGLPGPWPRVALLLPASPFYETEQLLLRMMLSDVANWLARYRTMAILAPHSSFSIAHDGGIPLDNDKPAVDFTVSGTVFGGPNVSRLSMRLVDCASTMIVWSNDYDVSFPQLQQSGWLLARHIADSIVRGFEQHILQSRRAFSSNAAYISYLTGCSHLGRTDLRSVRRARKHLFDAHEADRHNGAVLSRLAFTYYLEWVVRNVDEPQLLSTARKLAEKGVDADRLYPFSFAALGAVKLHQRDFDGAIAAFEEAEQLGPHDADILLQFADTLAHCGELQAAREKFVSALALNPMPPDTYWWTGASIAFDCADYRQAIAYCEHLSDDAQVYSLLAATHALLGERDEARRCYREHLDNHGWSRTSQSTWQNPDRPGSAAKEADQRFRRGLELASAM